MSIDISRVTEELVTASDSCLRRGRSASLPEKGGAAPVGNASPTVRQSLRLKRPSGKARSAEEQQERLLMQQQQQTSTVPVMAKKRATVACRSCRAFKCSGERPCELCLKRNNECVYDHDPQSAARDSSTKKSSTLCKRTKKSMYRRDRGKKALVVTVSADVFVDDDKETDARPRSKRRSRRSSDGSEVRSVTRLMQTAHIAGSSSSERNKVPVSAASSEREVTVFEFDHVEPNPNEGTARPSAYNVHNTAYDYGMSALAPIPPMPYAGSSHDPLLQESLNRSTSHKYPPAGLVNRWNGVYPSSYPSHATSHQGTYPVNSLYDNTPAYTYGQPMHGYQHFYTLQRHSPQRSAPLQQRRSYPPTPYDTHISDVRSTKGQGYANAGG